MALLNQSCVLYYGKNGNISRFILKDDVVYRTCLAGETGTVRNEILTKGADEIKACSDGKKLYLFCVDTSGDIEIFISGDERTKSSIIKAGNPELIIRDVLPYMSGDRCELMISYSKTANRNERMLSKISVNADMLSQGCRYPCFTVKDLMEYEVFGPVDEMAAAGYEEENSNVLSVIEKNEESNSIILLKDNRFGYVEGLIKISMDRDILWHDISVNGSEADVVYTVREGEYFSIYHMVYDIRNHRLSEEYVVRKKAPCSHPVLIRYKDEKWICWYENGAVYSRKEKAKGEFESAVKRKESIGKKLYCAHFFLDDERVKKQTGAGFRKVFLIYPDNIMTGF